MPHTQLYTHLIRREQELRKALFPRRLSPTGNYNRTTYQKIDGYKVLIHAELEYYFEEITKSLMRISKNDWDTNKKASKTLVALLAYSKKVFPSIPESQNDQNIRTDLNRRISDAYTEHYSYIQAQNHGIKEKNILALLLPVGIEVDEIDNNLLIALNNFGSDRGRIAHTTRTIQNTTPEDAQNTVAQILTLVDTFDCQMVQSYNIT